MCGIVGFIGKVRDGQWRQTHDLIRALFLSAEHRGRDATGFVAQTDPLNRPRQEQIVVAKNPMSASEFVEFEPAFLRLRNRRCSAIIGHVRAATHGKPEDNRNNHPFTGKGLFLVHNGVITNDADLTDKYGLERKTECDSEALLRLVEMARHPLVGLSVCLQEVQGSMAVAVYDSRARMVWFARNDGRPLWLAQLRNDRRWFFASTDAILLHAFRTVLGDLKSIDYLAPVPSRTVLAVTEEGSVIAPNIDANVGP